MSFIIKIGVTFRDNNKAKIKFGTKIAKFRCLRHTKNASSAEFAVYTFQSTKGA
jgi:hypothetical protein